MCKKSLFVFSIVAVLACYWRTSNSRESKTATAKGISCVFFQKRELLSGSSWSSKPLDVLTAEKNVGRYDAFWCAQIMAQYNYPVWQFLRQNRPDQIMLYYISATTTRKTNVRTYLDYDYIETHHPEWFLLKDARNATPRDYKDENKRMRWNPSDPTHSYYNRFYVDVTNKDFQQWAASQALDLVSGKKDGLAYSYNGLAMDNVYVGARLHERLRRRYPRWKYANNLKDWQKGFGDYLKAIRGALNRHGYILVVNHNPVGRDRSKNDEVWDILCESSDGILSEQALRSGWGNSPYFANNEWLAAMARHEEMLEKGVINWWVCRPEASGQRAHDVFLYTYCSWLLIKQPGKSYYSVMSEEASGAPNIPWYDEYDLPIDEPTSKRYLQEGCWFRNYTNAKIVVNPTEIPRKVIIDRNKLWLDWTSKKAIRELKLPPQSGRILLPTSQDATEKH